MSAPAAGETSPPSPFGAVALTLGAWAVLSLLFGLIAPGLGATAGLAVGSVVGLGGLGTLAARGVPPPADARLGLRGFPARLLLALALLLPTALLVSELDNWIAAALERPLELTAAPGEGAPAEMEADAAPAPAAETQGDAAQAPGTGATGPAHAPAAPGTREGSPEDATPDAREGSPETAAPDAGQGSPETAAPDAGQGPPEATAADAAGGARFAPPGDLWVTLEWALFAVLLRPVLEEFFFRGLLQQGVVASLGALRGVLLTALLFAAVRASFGVGSAYVFATVGAQAAVLGGLLGWLRLVSGSILPGILLQGGLAAVGLAGLVLSQRIAIAGFNAEGAHTPAGVLVGCALSVAAGLALAARASRPAGGP